MSVIKKSVIANGGSGGGGSGAVDSVFGRIGDVVADSGDYTASQITNEPQGNITADNVQDAINELDGLIPDLSGYVPFSGATESLNLDEHNLYAYNVINGLSNVSSSSGTTNITLASTRTQRLTGSQNHSFKFDDSENLVLSFEIEFLNESTGDLSIVDFSDGVQAIVPPGGGCVARLVGTGTAAGTWSIKNYIPRSATWGDEVLNIPFLSPSQLLSTDANNNIISVSQVRTEVSGVKDGINTTFTIPEIPIENSLSLYLNGQLLQEGEGQGYTVDGSTITLTIAPSSGESVFAIYLKSN